MRLYTFTEKDSNEIIVEVRAENHDQALSITGLNSQTDFYSSEI